MALSRRRTFALCCAICAAGAGTVFLAISVDHYVYAPGAKALHFGYGQYLDAIRPDFPRGMRHDINAYFLLRKAYSIVAFAIVGIFVAAAIPKHRRTLRSAIIVGLFSTLIEIAQKIQGVHEGIDSNLFDIACGVLGGIIGALCWNLIRVAMRRSAKR